MKKISIDVLVEKLIPCLIMLLLMITPTIATNTGQNGFNSERIEGAGTESTYGIMRIVDFHNLAIFAGYWLETECNAANNFCGGADLDHMMLTAMTWTPTSSQSPPKCEMAKITTATQMARPTKA